jgi:hypothetical protein
MQDMTSSPASDAVGRWRRLDAYLQQAVASLIAVVAKRLDPKCMSARYAEAVLNGESADVEKMQRLAGEIIGR